MAISNAQREEVRNRLLRRADWRFLLPNPNPPRSVCFADGLLAEAVSLISDVVADPRVDRPAGDCDLAVAVNPDRERLCSAWGALRPGGSCYTEWYSVLSGGPRGVRARLEAAGFQDVTCYWPGPDPSRSTPQLWLPLEAPGALRYFLTRQPSARNIVRRIGRAARHARWLLSPPIRLTLPICAIARKPASSAAVEPSGAGRRPEAARRPLGASECHAELVATIRAGWSGWGLHGNADHLSWLLLTGGPRSVSKVVAMVFGEPDPRPQLAVKMSRIPESIPALAKEAATLEALQARRGLQGVPRLVFRQQSGGVLAVGETALTGFPLFSVLTRDSYRSLALKATDWLTKLAGRPEPSPSAGWWSRLIEPVLADFDSSFGAILDPLMVREAADILSTLSALPLVCEQRDFSPWNLLVTATGELAVLDWESAELQGLPALDLVYFLTYLAFMLEDPTLSGPFRECYRTTLDPSTLAGAVSHECLARYTGTVGLGASALRALRVFLWMLHSRSEYRHFVADVAGRPDQVVLRRSLFVALWEEELRHAART